MNRATAARRIQNIFRAKRVFTNTMGSLRFSKPIINAFVATIDGYLDVDFSKPPVGFKEVEGFLKGSKAASVRYVNGK